MSDIFEDYYSKRGVDTDEVHLLPGYLLGVLPGDTSARILDIGCGPGQTLDALRRAGYSSLRGIDISEQAVEACRRKGLDVVLGDLREFAERGEHERFDFVLMNHVLEHLPKDDVVSTLETIRLKLLTPEGRFFVSVPNAQSNTGCYWAYEDYTHNTLFTAGSLAFVLKSAGFRTVTFVDPDGTEGQGRLNRLLKRALLPLYARRIDFWNWVTSSSYHVPSPRIYTYEIKAIASAGPTSPAGRV